MILTGQNFKNEAQVMMARALLPVTAIPSTLEDSGIFIISIAKQTEKRFN